ncbi:MAG: hypothetical protein WBO10_08670 [Pyrinomonadaceae bacterium]
MFISIPSIMWGLMIFASAKTLTNKLATTANKAPAAIILRTTRTTGEGRVGPGELAERNIALAIQTVPITTNMDGTRMKIEYEEK